MNIPSSSATGVAGINSSTTLSAENTKSFQIGTIKNAVQNVENSNDNNSIIDNCKMILEQSNNANNNNQNQSNQFVNVSPSNSGLVTFLQIDPQQQINNQLLLADRQQQQQQTHFQQQQLSSIMNMQQQQQSSRFPQNIHQRRTIPSQIMLSTINQNNQQSRSQQFNVNQQENNFPTIPFGPNQSQWFAPQRQLTKGNNTMMMMMNQNNHQNLLFNNQQQPQIPIVYPSTMAIRPPPGFCPNATTAASSNNMNQWQQPSISQLSKNSEKCLTRMLSTLAYQFHQQQQQQQQMSMTHRNCPQSISSVNNNNSGNSNQQSVIYDFVNPNFTQATNMTATEQCNNNHNHWPQSMLGCGQGHNGQTRFNHPLMTRLFCPQSIYFQQQQQQRLTLLQQQQQNQIINQFQCLANYNEQMNDENTNNRSFQCNKNGQNLNPNATDFFPTIINNNNRQKQFDNFDKTSSFNCFDVKFNNSNNENLINFQQTTTMPAFESECSMEKFRRQIINSNDELNTKFSPITNDIASWNDYVTKIIDEDDDSFDVDNNNDKENQNDSIECLFESINLSDDDNQSIDIDSNKLNDVDDNSIIENNNTNNNSSNIIQHDDSIRTIEHCQHVSPESKQIESVMQPNVDNIDDGNSILINEIATTTTPLRDRCVSLNTGTMMIMNDPKAAHLLTCQHYHHHHQQQQQQQYHQNHTHHLNHQTINHHKRRSSMSSNDSILSLLSHSTLINNTGRNRSNTVSTMIGGYCAGNSSNTNDILIQSKRFIKFDRYKTELCIYKSEIGECPYGDQCCFAHGLDEIRPRPLHDCKERTQPCESFSKGVCYRGSSRCWYLHPKPEFNMERLRNDLHHWLFNEKFDKDLFIENSKEWFDDDWDPKFHELIDDNNNNYKSLVEQSKDNDFDDINMDIRFDFGDKELNEYFDFQCNYYPFFKDIMQSITMMVKKSETKTNITISNSNDENMDNPKFHYNWSKAGCSAATDNVIRQSFHSILSNSTIKNEHIENKHVNSNQNTDQSSSIQALLSEISNLSLDHNG